MAYDSLIIALQQMLESHLSEVNTQIPGTIVSYDPKRNRAVVRPALPRRLASDEPLAPPDIVEVPIVWSSGMGGTTSFTMPVKAGDGVMLAFQQRSLEGWLSGKTDMPDDPRQFDLSDCVALPGCSHSGISADPTDVVLKFNDTELRITPEGTVSLGNANGAVTIDKDGNMILKAKSIHVETPAHQFTLETHQHIGVRSGPDVSGTPI
jgi:hypothetical protein